MQISVVIPTYNRASRLPDLLDCWRIVNAATSLEYELIFSDDGSDDDTVAVLEAVDDLPIKLLRNEHGGASSARNKAVAAAVGERVIFVGDDIYPEPLFLAKHYYLGQEMGEDVAILGRVDWHYDQPVLYLLDHITEVGNEQFSFNRMATNRFVDFRHFYTCNISVSKKMLDTESTHFDLDFYKVNFEDIELAYRLADNGMKILYREDIFGYHYHVYDTAGFCRRQSTAGEMSNVLLAKHPELKPYVIAETPPGTVQTPGKMSEDPVTELIDVSRALEAIWARGYLAHKRQVVEQFLSVLYSQLFAAKFEEGTHVGPGKQASLEQLATIHALHLGHNMAGQLIHIQARIARLEDKVLAAELTDWLNKCQDITGFRLPPPDPELVAPADQSASIDSIMSDVEGRLALWRERRGSGAFGA